VVWLRPGGHDQTRALQLMLWRAPGCRTRGRPTHHPASRTPAAEARDLQQPLPGACLPMQASARSLSPSAVQGSVGWVSWRAGKEPRSGKGSRACFQPARAQRKSLNTRCGATMTGPGVARGGRASTEPSSGKSTAARRPGRAGRTRLTAYPQHPGGQSSGPSSPSGAPARGFGFYVG